MAEAATESIYVIVGGGARRFFERWARGPREERRAASRRIAIAVALTYAPILLTALTHRSATGHWPVMAEEIATHVRVLVVIPALLFAETLIDARARDAGGYLVQARLVLPDRAEALRAVVANTARLRDSVLVEAALVLAAGALTVAAPANTHDPGVAAGWSLAPAAFAARFLLLRLLWRWLTWGVYVQRLVRLPIACHVSHPDRVAGLSPLAGPSVGFCVVIFAVGSNVAAVWADAMRLDGVHANSLLPAWLAFGAAAFLVTTAPLGPLSVPLLRLRWRGVHTIGALAGRASESFEHRWTGAAGADALASNEMQSMNDLGGVFERVEGIRVLVLPRALLTMLLASLALPALPLAVAEVGTMKLLLNVARALL